MSTTTNPNQLRGQEAADAAEIKFPKTGTAKSSENFYIGLVNLWNRIGWKQKLGVFAVAVILQYAATVGTNLAFGGVESLPAKNSTVSFEGMDSGFLWLKKPATYVYLMFATPTVEKSSYGFLFRGSEKFKVLGNTFEHRGGTQEYRVYTKAPSK